MQLRGELLDLRMRCPPCKGVVVDADGKSADTHFASTVAGDQYLAVAADPRLRNEYAQTLHEVAAVAQRLEPDDVVLQQRMQQRHAPGKLHEQVERRKRDVEKEPDDPLDT